MRGKRKNIENIGLLSSSEDAVETRAPVLFQLVNVFTKAGYTGRRYAGRRS